MRTLSPLRPAGLAVVLCTVAALCNPMVARAQVTAKPFEAYSNSARTLRDSIVATARAQIGTKYISGGQSPARGFDCSGLIKYVMAALDLKVPRTARQQARVGTSVGKDTSGLLPGDLLTFGKGKKGAISHVGIYIGDGKYIHASSKAGKVIESRIDRPFSPLIRMWKGSRRVLSSNDSLTAAGTVAVKGGGGN